MTNFYTLAEVAAHKDESDLWMVISDKVYDLTKYLAEHPGGDILMVRVENSVHSLFFLIV